MIMILSSLMKEDGILKGGNGCAEWWKWYVKWRPREVK